ncbi:hypothetical protein [Saliphagus infecundisoli]|uniref:ABC-2 type transport system permease protein n=1 Tax=Saliphagus infecundisoli TaxID=1849069 RepID=A0ABD5QAJ0_9EURY|nr:hypothetical protein [Saliphagus infecundisoli]
MVHRSIARDVRDARLIAGTEFRRTLRAIRANDSRFASVVVLALFTVPMGLVWLYGAYALGEGVDVGPGAAPLIGSFVLPAVAGFAATVAFQTVQDGPFPDHPTLPLSIASTRAVVLSKLFAALVAVAVWLVVPTVVFGGAFLAGAGAGLLAPAVAVWLVPIVLAAVPLGYLAGLWLIRLNRRLPVPTAGKAGVWAVFVLGSIVVGQRVGYVVADEGLGSLETGFLPAFGPTTAYASLLFGGGELPMGLAVGAALLAVGAIVARRATTEAAELWFADRPDSAENEPEGSMRPPTPFALTKTGRVAWHYLRLAYRAPRRLTHLLFLLFLVFPMVGPLAEAELAALRFAPSVGVLACALLAGATFSLNPIGDERGTLPVVLLSGTDAAAFVRGRVLAGLVVGLAALVACVALGAAVGVPPVALGLLALLAVGLSPAAGGVAAGFGVLLPKYEPEEIFGVETVRPSNVPLFAFEIGTIAVSALGLLVVGAPAPTVGSLVSRWPFVLAYAAVVAGSGAVGYLVAVRRLGAWTVER